MLIISGVRRCCGIETFWGAILRSGGNYLLATILLCTMAAYAQAAVVLQYHHVSESTPASTSITPALFKQHMDYLAEQEFKVVPLPELVSLLKDGTTLPDKTVAITFDDAYESVYSEAYPLLKKRGWPFTVFINTDPHDQNKRSFATWDQIKEMGEYGATIANHTTRHSHLLRLRDGESRAQWRKRIKQEVMDAEQRIKEKTGQQHRLLAYPYGEYDNHVKKLLKDLDFVAFGQQSGPLFALNDLLALPRFPFGGSYGDLQDFATKVNTRPFAVASVELYEDASLKTPLKDLVLPHGQTPVLVLTLEDKHLLSRISCFASGQGAIKTEVQNEKLIVQANKPLPAGRTRYNCTAPTGEKGRFFWLSQQWLTKGSDGRWAHED